MVLENFLERFNPVGLIFIAVLVMLSTHFWVSYNNNNERLSQGYTVKLLDSQGHVIEEHKNKTFEVEGNKVYLCPKGTNYCSTNSKAIIINGNYIIEPDKQQAE